MFNFIAATVAILVACPFFANSSRAVTLHPGDTVYVSLSVLSQDYGTVGLQFRTLGPDLPDVGEFFDVSYFSDATTLRLLNSMAGTGNPTIWGFGSEIGTGTSSGYYLIDNIIGTFDLDLSTILALGSVDGYAFTEYTPAVGEYTPAIPLPAALPLFAAGLGAMGFMGWRRKRKVVTN